MREATRRKAIETALDPMRRHPTAQAVLTDYAHHGKVTQPTIDLLLARADGASAGERTLLDLVAVLLDYTADQTPHAHPARAFYLGDRFFRAYVGALAIVATGGADPADRARSRHTATSDDGTVTLSGPSDVPDRVLKAAANWQATLPENERGLATEVPA